MSGLQLNLNKSKLFSINTSEDEVKEWAGAIDCSVGRFASDYLGLPLGANKNSIVLWDPVVQKFYKKLAGWKATTLSLTGRLVLLKANVDAVVSGDWKKSGIGGILRDDVGSVLGSFQEATGPGPPTLLELKAIKKGLTFFDSLRQRFKKRLIIESDSKLTVVWVKNIDRCPNVYVSIVKDVRLRALEGVIRWVARTTNIEADGLAKAGIG
ncbi:uncharacterized protein LOC120145964 [Hibiscus syriacus]|uniref:uncharacterized protein LOC120145964 n=1 Tax=Hibiscus syriacus TaxID=106335 RepID=UPI0019228688|nr:uncharacterized protein LOC120145964 [Hibiscus syriacus]